MNTDEITVAPEYEKGELGISYLKTIWSHEINRKLKGSNNSNKLKYNLVTAVFDALGIGIEPTLQYLYKESPSFAQFEHWIASHGQVSQKMIAMFNAAILAPDEEFTCTSGDSLALDDEDIRHWEEEGYLVISDVISQEDCQSSVNLIYDFLEIDHEDESSWYAGHEKKQGIMVQLFHHEQLNKNRFSEKLIKIYQQLWKKQNLTVSMDRVSFNPPETASYQFPGPDLHWDVSLQQPIPYGIQGLIYLSDTPANQGAFTLVPGFHRRIDDWLSALPENKNPRECDLHELGAKPIAGKAGDFIIWNHKLPHGSSPNYGKKPRIVQYINYMPINREIQVNWI